MELNRILDTLQDMPWWFLPTVIAMFAGLLGSFINVCIFRLPRGESIVTPRSRCPHCGTVLGVPDLVPILSWCVLRGRCRHCSEPISFRYTVVEFIVVVVWLAAYFLTGLGGGFLILALIGSATVAAVGVLIHGRRLSGSGRIRGLTFLEILFSSIILATVITPFLSLNWQGRSGTMRNRERVIAYALAREKLEMLRCLPTRKLMGDFLLYRGPSTGSEENIFRDVFFGTWARMDDDQDLFWSTWSDIVTEDGETAAGAMPEIVFEKFKERWYEYHGIPWEPYPSSYTLFRRFTRVDDLTDSSDASNVLKRVIVTVEIDSAVHRRHRISLASYYSDN